MAGLEQTVPAHATVIIFGLSLIHILTREQFATYMMQDPADFYYGVLWNKLYRRRVIADNHLEMDAQMRWCEDFLFNLSFIRHAETFTAIQTVSYTHL